ncbi:MAG: D-glucuronyl C5-epimerase family protein [Candidatus Cloacimonetes bacterium]|nr:D-glucuronyl C5-epimerase family protein [Candidatus Cloacimonadota bacterium]
MRKHKTIWLSLIISFLFTAFIWQIAEPEIVEFAGKACFKITRSSFIEVNTEDAAGIPMRYYPHVGKVYDPELIATEASRCYNTRLEPVREQRFLQLSAWLIKNIDATGMIPQTYDFPPALLKAPWYSSATQSAAMLALAQRAGFLRSKEPLILANKMLQQLDPKVGKLSRAESDSTIWFVSYPNYAVRGMLNTLLNLHIYYEIRGDPLAKELFEQGMRLLQTKLNNLEDCGVLNDRYTHVGERKEQRQLTNLLEKLNEISPSTAISAKIACYKRVDKHFAVYQMLAQRAGGRMFRFFIAWLFFSLLIRLFLRVPK